MRSLKREGEQGVLRAVALVAEEEAGLVQEAREKAILIHEIELTECGDRDPLGRALRRRGDDARQCGPDEDAEEDTLWRTLDIDQGAQGEAGDLGAGNPRLLLDLAQRRRDDRLPWLHMA